MARVSSLPSLKGQFHPVYSLLDNRLAAHLMRAGGLFIPVGHPATAKYINFGRPWRTWRMGHKLEGRRVALATRPKTYLSFPLSEPQRAATKLTISLYSPKSQGLKLRLNNRSLPTTRLASGWQVKTIKLPPSSTRVENRLEFNWAVKGLVGGTRAPGAVEWLHLHSGAALTSPLTVPIKDQALYLPSGGGVAYYIHPYAGARLRLLFGAQAQSRRCSLKVSLSTSPGTAPTEVTLTEKTLAPGSKVDTFVDLKPIAGKTTRLELSATGASCKELLLRDASIVMPGPAPAKKRGAAPDNVLFWMIDNVRADRYSAYNPGTRVKTPVIDKLVKTGTVFTKAYIQGTESRVSHASIWTGLYPRQHRFVAPKAKLSLAWQTIPESARKAGLYTAAWIANGFVSKFWGFGEGWSSFRNTLHKGGGLNGEALANHAIKFVQKRGDRRFYLYVGTIDPHVSWRGRQPWLKQYHPEPYKGMFKKNVWGKDVEKIATGKRKTSSADRKRIMAIYDSTVSYNDHHLGRLLKALEDRGIRQKTMIVITADHGEELWDYGRLGHGHSCRHKLVAVPLIIHYPPLFGSGVRVTEGVDVLSLFPTIMDALGAEIPPKVQGESLLALAQGVGRGYPRPSLATQYEFAHTIRLEQWKLRVGGKGVPRLSDLRIPRSEKTDLSSQQPHQLRWLTDALSTFLIYQSRWRSLRWGVASNHKAAFPQDMESGNPPDKIRPY